MERNLLRQRVGKNKFIGNLDSFWIKFHFLKNTRKRFPTQRSRWLPKNLRNLRLKLGVSAARRGNTINSKSSQWKWIRD
jgi:hypothetical protein